MSATDRARAERAEAVIARALALIEPREYYEAKPHKAHRDLEWVRDALFEGERAEPSEPESEQ